MDGKRNSGPSLAIVVVCAIASSFVSTDAAAVGEEQICHQQREDLFQSLEQEREVALAKVEAAVQATTDEAEKAQLRYDGEQLWQIEERMRSVAEQMWRDCMQHARSLK